MLHNKLTKVNIIKMIVIILLMLTSITALQKAYTLTAYATDVDETDKDHKSDEKTISGGVYYTKTGFVCYLASEEGALKSQVVACWPNQAPPGGELSSRVGNVTPSRQFTQVPWVPNSPWGDGGVAYGGKIKQWFLADNGAELKNFVTRIGVDYETAVAEGWWLVIEQVSWCKYTGSSGSIYCGTTWHWGEYVTSLLGASSTGNANYGKYSNGVFPDCMKFERNGCGLTAMVQHDAGNRYTAGACGTQTNALGCMRVRLNNNCIDTYWEPHGSPGKPEPSDPPKDGTFNIVKAYHEKKYQNGALISDTHVTTTSTLNCIPNINIMDESMCPAGYHLEYWVTDSDLNTGITFQGVLSKSGKRHGIGATQITMDPKAGEKTVYLSLVKDENEEEEFDWNYILTESMVTRMIWENHPDNRTGMEFLEDTDFTWESSAHKQTCGGHKCNGYKVSDSCSSSCPTGCSGGHSHTEYHTYYCTFGSYKGTDYIDFTLKNSQQDSYPDILATKDGTYEIIFANDTHGIEHRHEPEMSWSKDKRQTLDAEKWETSAKEDWDYVCILMRGADKLTVAQWVNEGQAAANDASAEANSFLEGLSSSGFTVANKHEGSRKKGFYKETFTMNFVNGEGDYSTTWYVTKKATATCSCGGGPWDCSNTRTYIGTTMSTNVVVKVDTYSGNPKGGTDDKSVDHSAKITGLPGMPGYASSSNTRVSGRQIQAETISFQPYVLMQYQTLESGAAGYPNTYDTHSTGWNPVYVLGQYSRALTPNDYAEISWTYKSSPNLTLVSTQWSTHALATQTWGTSNVLPGGATLGLTIKTADRQKVYVTTYYTYTDGKGKLQCENTGGNPGTMDEATARGDHQAFAESVSQGLDNTVVQQWQSDKVDDTYAWNHGIMVNRGKSLSGINVSGTKSSEDEKYYFEHDVIGSGRGNYDTKVEQVQFNTFTVYVDTNGAVACAKNNPDMFWGDHSGDYALSALNARTGVVDKLIEALEAANDGDDTRDGHSETCYDEKALNGSKWYNEAFDGITIAVEESLVTVGFIDPAERTEVLDPKLTKQQDSKSGQMGMNFDDGDVTGRKSTYELAQFKTRDHSEAWGTFEVEGYFFNNVNGDEVAQDDLEHLFWSRKFWIPNFTTQDIY